MQLTTPQLKSLLLNARGFLDDYGTFLTCSEWCFQDESFHMLGEQNERVSFKYTNAKLQDSSKLQLEWLASEETELLVVLIPLSEARDILDFIKPSLLIEE